MNLYDLYQEEFGPIGAIEEDPLVPPGAGPITAADMISPEQAATPSLHDIYRQEFGYISTLGEQRPAGFTDPTADEVYNLTSGHFAAERLKTGFLKGVQSLRQIAGSGLELFGQIARLPVGGVPEEGGGAIAHAARFGRSQRQAAGEAMEAYDEQLAEMPDRVAFTIPGTDVSVREAAILGGVAESIAPSLALIASSGLVTAAAAPTLAQVLAPRLAASIAGRLIPKLAARPKVPVTVATALASGTAFEAIFEGSAQYGQAKEEGLPEEEAQRQAAVVGALNVGTVATKIAGAIPGLNLPVRFVLGSFLDAAEETYQDVASRYAAGEEIALDENMAVAALTGAILGGGFNLVQGVGTDLAAQSRLMAEAEAAAEAVLREHGGDVGKALEYLNARAQQQTQAEEAQPTGEALAEDQPSPRRPRRDATMTPAGSLAEAIYTLGGVFPTSTFETEYAEIGAPHRSRLARAGIVNAEGFRSDQMLEMLREDYPNLAPRSESALIAALAEESMTTLRQTDESFVDQAFREEEARRRAEGEQPPTPTPAPAGREEPDAGQAQEPTPEEVQPAAAEPQAAEPAAQEVQPQEEVIPEPREDQPPATEPAEARGEPTPPTPEQIRAEQGQGRPPEETTETTAPEGETIPTAPETQPAAGETTPTQPETTPEEAPAEQQSGPTITAVTHKGRKSIEVSFPEKPDRQILGRLKAGPHRFRWSKTKKVWYAMDTPESRKHLIDVLGQTAQDQLGTPPEAPPAAEQTVETGLADILDQAAVADGKIVHEGKTFDPEGEFELFHSSIRAALTRATLADRGGKLPTFAEQQAITRQVQARWNALKQELTPPQEAQDDRGGSPQTTERPGNEGQAPVEAGPAQDVQGPGAEGPVVSGPAEGAGTGLRDPATEPQAGDDVRTGERAGQRRPVSPRGERDAEPGGEPAGRDRPGLITTDNYTLPDDLALPAGEKERFRSNVEAIRVLKSLEAERRYATDAEKLALARYVGWGGLKNAFEFEREDTQTARAWAGERRELQNLLTEKEYRRARTSTLNAHYTSLPVIRQMWTAAERLGFTGGKALEPAAGVGHFIGAQPPDHRTRWTAVELDNLSGRITRKLYGQADVKIRGLQETSLNDDTFDLVISNVPFGNYPVSDPKVREKLSIHNYFFVKGLRLAKPGGLVAFITSNFTLDAKTASAVNFRRNLAAEADFLGAIRLPNTAFKDNASTEVTTDIIFLRKKPWAGSLEQIREGPAEGQAENYTALLQRMSEGVPLVEEIAFRGVRDGPNGTEINEYFVKNPDMMLGKPSMEGTMYGPGEQFALLDDGRDLQKSLSEAIARLPENVIAPQEPNIVETTPEILETAERIQPYQIVERDGRFFQGDDRGRLAVLEVKPGEIPRLRDMLKVRDVAVQLMAGERSGEVEQAALDKLRKDLNYYYNRFISRHKRTLQGKKNQAGALNWPVNARLLEGDPDQGRVLALEKYSHESGIAEKADIFRQRISFPDPPLPTQAETDRDALIQSLNRHGYIDPNYMSQLRGGKGTEVVDNLVKEGLLFYNPAKKAYEQREQYLAGDLRVKIQQAEEAGFTDNVDALTEVMPTAIGAEDLSVRMGSPWVPTQYVEQFIEELLGHPVEVDFQAQAAYWNINDREGRATASSANNVEFGTDARSALELITAALNHKPVTVYFPRNPDGSSGGIDREATTEARSKQRTILDRYNRWILAEPSRANELADLYNTEINVYKVPEYDGSHLKLPGMSATLSLYPRQKNAVWRILQDGRALLAHAVGAGKTAIIAAAAMENRRLGLARKQVVVVPKSTLTQWQSEFLKFYPNANILVSSDREFQPQRRRAFLSRMQTGDWDAIILTHEQFQRIPISRARLAEFEEAEADRWESAIQQIRREEGSRSLTLRELEQARERVMVQIDRMVKAVERDRHLIPFDELGIDMIYVDEAHLFKTLFFPTRMTRVPNVGNPQGAQRALDLFFKSRHIMEANDNRGLVFATATPLTNTITEIYTTQRYLQPDELERRSIDAFDNWANMFGEIVPVTETAVSGVGYRIKERFAKFINVPELAAMWRGVSDVVTPDMLEMNRPAFKRFLHEAPPSEWHRSFVYFLNQRYQWIIDNWRDAMESDEPLTNVLEVVGAGKKAALDPRLVDPTLPAFEGGKLYQAADQIARIYKETGEQLGTQLVFADLGTPKPTVKKDWIAERASEIRTLTDADADQAKADATAEYEQHRLEGTLDSGEFNTYDALRQLLVERGVPTGEIVYVHAYKTDRQRVAFREQVNAGKIRVVIGSTPKMGVGMNLQERLIALHHLDAPWRPDWVEQREGRIVRQGNKWAEWGRPVELHTYVTEKTLDAFSWQTLQTKATAIQQLITAEITAREIDDIDAEASQYEVTKLAAMGDPEAVEKFKLDQQLAELLKERNVHESSRWTAERRIDELEGQDEFWNKKQKQIRQDISDRGEVNDDTIPEFSFVEDYNKAGMKGEKRIKFTDARQAGTHLFKKVLLLDAQGKTSRGYTGVEVTVGSVGLFDLVVKATGGGNMDVWLQSPGKGPLEAAKYPVRTTKTSDGTIRNVILRYREGPETALENAKYELSRVSEDLPRMKTLLETPFQKEAEYNEVAEKVKKLEESLREKGADESTRDHPNLAGLVHDHRPDRTGNFAAGLFDAAEKADQELIAQERAREEEARKREEERAAQAEIEGQQSEMPGQDDLFRETPDGQPSGQPSGRQPASGMLATDTPAEDVPEDPPGNWIARRLGKRKTHLMVSRPQIVEAATRILRAVNSQAPVKVGRVRSRTAAGIFKYPVNVIRLRDADSIPELTHEIGHALEWALFGDPHNPSTNVWTPKSVAGLTGRMQTELVLLGKDLYGDKRPRGGYKSEGFAEFMRGYITGQNDVKKKAPAFARWFDQRIAKHPALEAPMERTRVLAHQWYALPPNKRVGMSMTGIGPVEKRAQEAIQRIKGRLRDKKVVSEIKRRLYEAGVPIENWVNEIRRLRAEQARPGAVVREIRPSKDAFRTFTAFRNNVDKQVQNFVEWGVRDRGGRKLSGSLRDALDLVKGRDWEFAQFLLARRTLQLARPNAASGQRPRTTGVQIADAAATYELLRSEEFEISAKKVHEWMEAVLDYASQSSNAFAGIVQKIRASDDLGWYIPLLVDFLGEKPPGAKTNRGNTASGSPFPRLKGSGRPKRNPFMSLIDVAHRIVEASNKQAVLIQLIELAAATPNSGHLAEQIPKDPTVTKLRMSQIKQALEAEGWELQEIFPEDGAPPKEFDGSAILAFFGVQHTPTDPNIVTYVDGEGTSHWYEIKDDSVLEALGALNMPDRINPFLRALRLTAQTARAGTTGLSASFNLLMNLPRDFFTMFINQKSEAGPHRLFLAYLDYLRQGIAGSITRRQQDELYQMAEGSGVTKSRLLAMDIDYSKAAARNLFRSFWQQAADPRNWFNIYRDAIQAPETAPRMAEFSSFMREAGFTTMEAFNAKSLDQRLDMLIPAMEGYRRITGDFGAGGSTTQRLGRYIPFLTSAIQGPRSTFRRIKQDPKTVLPKIIAYIVLPSLYLWWKDKDEDWYQEIPWRERHLFWHIKEGDEVIRIPKPFEIGLFGSLAVTLADTWYHQDSDNAQSFFEEFWGTDFIQTGFEAVTPPIMPVPAEFIMEQWRNKIVYFDRPIVPRSLQDAPAEQQYGLFTARAAIVAGDILGLSPNRIEHAWRSFFGTLGGQVLHLSLGTGEEGRGSAVDLAKKFLGMKDSRPIERSDLFILGRAFKRGGTSPHRSESVDRLFDEYQKALRRQNDRQREETTAEREHRLMLTDAVRCIYLLGALRFRAPKSRLREINWERARCARLALSPDTRRKEMRELRREVESRRTVQKFVQGKLDQEERQQEIERLTARIYLMHPGNPQRNELVNRRFQLSGGDWKSMARRRQVRSHITRFKREAREK